MTVNLPSWLPIPVILFLSLLGVLAIYFIVGSMVRYRKGMRKFPEVLPNYGCWCSACSFIAMVLTCGRCRSRYAHRVHTLNRVGAFMDRLPRRTRARHLAFETLQSDWEDEYADEAMFSEASANARSENAVHV